MTSETSDKLPPVEAERVPLCVASKLPYAPPTLKEFGAVSKLTMNGRGSGTDGGHVGMSRKSDRRLKDDIVRIGDHPLGFGVYLFSYKAAFQEACGAGRHLGVMADEVEPILPEAVTVGPDGYKMVDYTRLMPSRTRTSH